MPAGQATHSLAPTLAAIELAEHSTHRSPCVLRAANEGHVKQAPLGPLPPPGQNVEMCTSTPTCVVMTTSRSPSESISTACIVPACRCLNMVNTGDVSSEKLTPEPAFLNT